MRWNVSWMPGVKEHDIPNAPREYQEAMVYKLREMAQEKHPRGLRLTGGLQGYWKAYIAPPEKTQDLHQNKSRGRNPADGANSGGYRLVYQKTEVRGEPTLVIAAFGPRKNSQVYDAAKERIAEREQAQQRRSQALSGGAPSAQARRSLPRSPRPSQGPPQASGQSPQQARRPPRP